VTKNTVTKIVLYLALSLLEAPTSINASWVEYDQSITNVFAKAKKELTLLAKIVDRMDTWLKMADWKSKHNIYANQTSGPSEQQLLCRWQMKTTPLKKNITWQVKQECFSFFPMVFHSEYMNLAGDFRIPAHVRSQKLLVCSNC